MPKILEFKNKGQKALEIRAKGPTKAEILLYGAIGVSFWEDSISAKTFIDQVKALEPTVNELTIRIHSSGGDVFEGYSIYNFLRQHKAKKIVYIDGLAASIASIIALAGDEVIMGEIAQYMIHLPWTFTAGNRMELDNVTDRLIAIENQMIGIYAKKSGKSHVEIKALLEAETYFDTDAAIEYGFVDKKAEESIPIAASIFEKSTWINKAPKKFVSEAEITKQEIANLKSSIGKTLARK